MCRRGHADEVAKCLVQNPGLLNCLNGEPLSLSVMSREIGVIGVLMTHSGLEVNLKGESGSGYLPEGGNLQLLQHFMFKINMEELHYTKVEVQMILKLYVNY